MTEYRAALVNDNGEVLNVIVLDTDSVYEPAAGTAVHRLPDDSTVTFGWTRVGTEWIEPPVRSLTSSRPSIPADGETAAVVTYTDTFPDAPERVVFVVNGVDKDVALSAAGNAILDVVSTTPGDTVRVEVDGVDAVTITVEG